MSTTSQPFRLGLQWFCQLLERWFAFRCDLTELGLADGDVLTDLAAGRDE
jgi:hypothetical protein